MFKFFFGLDIQFQFAQNLLALMHLCDLPSKQKSGNLYNTLKSLLWLVIVYKVEKSNIGIDIHFPCSMKILIIFIAVSLFNPIQDGLFRSCSWMRGGQKAPTPRLKSVTHTLQWWNLAQLYITERRSKQYMNHVTHRLSSADISIFSPEIRKLC